MDPELQALLAKVPILQQKGAQPQEIDEWIAAKTGGKYASLQAAQQASAPSAPPGKSPGMMGLLDPFLQGATMNFADEGVGRLQSLLPGSGTYQQERDKFRTEEAQVRQEHPVLSKLAYGAGTLATMLPLALRGAKAAAEGIGLLPKLARGATVGAGVGAVSNAGEAPELQDVPSAAVAGAKMGAPFGAAGEYILPALVKAGLRLPDVLGKLFSTDYRDKAYARQMVLRALQESGIAPDAATGMLADLEKNAPGQARLADLSPRLGRELRASVNGAPALEVPVRDALAVRQAGQAGRVAGNLEDAMGVTGDEASGARQQAAASLPTLGRKVYGALDQLPMPTTGPALQQLAPILQQPEIAKLLERVSPQDQPMTFKTLQDLREQISSIISNQTKLANMSNTKQWFRDQYGALTDAMENAFPGFKSANKDYRTAATLVGGKDPVTGVLTLGSKDGAFNLGARAMNATAGDVDRIAQMLKTRGGQEALDAYRMGFIEKLTTSLRTLSPNRNALNAIPGFSEGNVAAETEQKLRLLFPTREGMDAFLQRAKAEGKLFGTQVATLGNSSTAKQEADMGLATVKAATGGVGGFKSFLADLMAKSLGSGSASREMAGRMLMARPGEMPDVVQQLLQQQKATRSPSSIWNLIGGGAGGSAAQSMFGAGSGQ